MVLYPSKDNMALLHKHQSHEPNPNTSWPVKTMVSLGGTYMYIKQPQIKIIQNELFHRHGIRLFKLRIDLLLKIYKGLWNTYWGVNIYKPK